MVKMHITCTHTYIHIDIYRYILFFRFFSTTVYYTMLNIVPCATL